MTDTHVEHARWFRRDAQRRARKAGAEGNYDEMMYWARTAARWTVLAVGWLALAGCADFFVRGEDSVIEGFVDGGQRWGW